VHPEYDPALLDSNNPDSVPVIAALKEDNQARHQLLRSLFRRLGLKTSEQPVEQPNLTNLGIVCVDEKTKEGLWKAILPTLLSDLTITSPETKDKIKFTNGPVPGVIAQEEKTEEGGIVVSAGFAESLEKMSFHSFDSNLYFQILERLRPTTKPSYFGSSLMYADVITSTQTVLEK